MSLKKDKQKVIDEVLDESHLRSFFSLRPPEGVNADYNILERAYRGMTADYFAGFLELFVAAGHDINAQNPDGKTILMVVSGHQQAGEYIEVLRQHGAVV